MKKQKGQVALLVLLISAIALTLGLSVSDRIRTNVKVDKDDELLQRAFNVAESAIESYVSRGLTEYEASDGSRASVTVAETGGELVDFGEFVPQDGYGFFWLVDHDENGEIDYGSHYPDEQIDICFNQFIGGVAVYYFKLNSLQNRYEVDRRVYNLEAGYINQGTDLSVEEVCSGYEMGIADFDLDEVTNGIVPLLLVIRPIGGGSKMAVAGNSVPSQGNLIIAEGVSGDASTVVKMLQKFDVGYYLSFLVEGVVGEQTIESIANPPPTGVPPTSTPVPTNTLVATSTPVATPTTAIPMPTLTPTAVPTIPSCVANGDPCSVDADCCSNFCDFNGFGYECAP